MMAAPDFLHDTVNGAFTGDFYMFWPLKNQCLIHADPTICIITFIFLQDFFHGICQGLIFPWTVFICQILVKSLPADMECPAEKAISPFESPSFVFIAINFILSFLLTSDGSQRKKRWLPPKSRFLSLNA